MSRPIAAYAEQIYAGLLGKIIGVYLGRPVEGWSYPSGSFAANGPTLPEQVGAQIFSDAIAMSYPGDPQRAAAAVRAAASVSHDGVAVDAAAFLAAMRALAFDRTDLIELVDRCRHEIHDRRLNAAVDRVVGLCEKTPDWREVREVIDDELGYARFDGPCHVIPNHAVTLAALLLGGDDFQRAIAVDGETVIDTTDGEPLPAGAAGFLIDEGTVYADDFQITGMPR